MPSPASDHNKREYPVMRQLFVGISMDNKYYRIFINLKGKRKEMGDRIGID